MDSHEFPTSTIVVTATADDEGELDIPTLGTVRRSQLRQLAFFIGSGFASATSSGFGLEDSEDRTIGLMDLTWMSVGQLRQLQTALGDISDSSETQGRHLINRLVPQWSIKETKYAALSVGIAPRGSECAICCQLVGCDGTITLPCSVDGCRSFFHDQCIRPWLERKPNCPLCRCELSEFVERAAPSPSRLCNAPAISQATSAILSNARVFASLCHIQAKQNCRRAPSRSNGSLVLGLFDRSGPLVISGGDLMSRLREQDRETSQGSAREETVLVTPSQSSRSSASHDRAVSAFHHPSVAQREHRQAWTSPAPAAPDMALFGNPGAASSSLVREPLRSSSTGFLNPRGAQRPMLSTSASWRTLRGMRKVPIASTTQRRSAERLAERISQGTQKPPTSPALHGVSSTAYLGLASPKMAGQQVGSPSHSKDSLPRSVLQVSSGAVEGSAPSGPCSLLGRGSSLPNLTRSHRSSP